jgi:hypothetical protein
MSKSKKKAPNPKPKTLKRRVFFYRINAGSDPATGAPRIVNFRQPLIQLETLPFNEDGRYLKTSDDDKQLCVWSDGEKNLPIRLRVAYIRRGAHPPIEHEGEFSPLVLPAGRGLAEVTHVMIFPDNICAAEFNFYGPRASQLAFYCGLKVKNDLCPPFKLNPLVRPDLQARLAKVTDIKVLDIKLRASYAETVRKADEDLGAALSASIKAVGARDFDEIEIRFVRKKKKKAVVTGVPQTLLAAVRSLAGNKDTRESMSTFKIDGIVGGSVSPFDILSEQFSETREVLPATDGKGGVDSASMFEAIEAAYSEVQSVLAAASELESQ